MHLGLSKVFICLLDNNNLFISLFFLRFLFVY
jgi:hypothetical protein